MNTYTIIDQVKSLVLKPHLILYVHFICLLDRLPSAMRPPVQKRGHCRSKSHGAAINPASIEFNTSLVNNSETCQQYAPGKL